MQRLIEVFNFYLTVLRYKKLLLKESFKKYFDFKHIQVKSKLALLYCIK